MTAFKGFGIVCAALILISPAWAGEKTLMEYQMLGYTPYQIRLKLLSRKTALAYPDLIESLSAIPPQTLEQIFPARGLVPSGDLKTNLATYQDFIVKSARKHGVQASLVSAVIQAESGFNPGSISPKGAQGLMQIMPDTAVFLKLDSPFDPSRNIEAGTRYLRILLDEFTQVDMALAAYNAGPEIVRKAGRIPRIPETEFYVVRVLNYERVFRKIIP